MLPPPLPTQTTPSHPNGKVASAVEKDEEEARLAAISSSSSDSESSSEVDKDDDGESIDVVGIRPDDGHSKGYDERFGREEEATAVLQREESGASGGVGDAVVSCGLSIASGVGERESSKPKRVGRLRERIMSAVAQCQACLYDIAVVPCTVSLEASMG